MCFSGRDLLLGLDGPVSSDVEALTDGNMSWMPLTGATTSFKPLCPWPKWSLCGCGWPGNSSCNEGSNLRLSRDDEVVSDALGAALAGAATVRTVPPRAASPNVKTAAVLAMRVLIM